MYLDICHCSQTFSTLISINNRKWLFSSQNLTDLLFVELSYVLQDFSFLPLAYSKVFQQNLIEMKLGHCFVLFFQCLPFLKNGIWMVKFLESSYILRRSKILILFVTINKYSNIFFFKFMWSFWNKLTLIISSVNWSKSWQKWSLEE